MVWWSPIVGWSWDQEHVSSWSRVQLSSSVGLFSFLESFRLLLELEVLGMHLHYLILGLLEALLIGGHWGFS